MIEDNENLDHPIVELAWSSRAAGQPTALFKAVDQMAQRETGRAFCTLLMVCPGGKGERIFSSNPTVFPLGGRKPLSGREWSRRVLDEGETFLARTPAEIRQSIDDSDGIEQLGCRSLVNIPIVHDGCVVATFNLGADEDRFDPDCIGRIEVLASLLGPSIAWLRLRGTINTGGDLPPAQSTEG